MTARARQSGASNYSLAKMMGLAFDALTSFSIMPLRLASYLGLLLGCLSLLDARLHARQLGARPCRRRLDQLVDGRADPGLDATHSVRPPRRICRAALSRNQATAAVRHRSGADAKRISPARIPRAARTRDRSRRRVPKAKSLVRAARTRRWQRREGARSGRAPCNTRR